MWVRRLQRGGPICRVVAVASIVGVHCWRRRSRLAVDAAIGRIDGGRCVRKGIPRLGNGVVEVGRGRGILHLLIVIVVVLLSVIFLRSAEWRWSSL
jgi:hypothetical protein